jgi:hypothetical protein
MCLECPRQSLNAYQANQDAQVALRCDLRLSPSSQAQQCKHAPHPVLGTLCAYYICVLQNQLGLGQTPWHDKGAIALRNVKVTGDYAKCGTCKAGDLSMHTCPLQHTAARQLGPGL